jgi:hypothetical protein
MAATTTRLLRCTGDDRRPGCGEPIAAFNGNNVYSLRSAEILSYDRLGRARIACRCTAITISNGHTANTMPERTA